MNHTIFVENKSKVTVTGVKEMGYYDDTSVTAFTDEGELNIRGENLRIGKIDTETGDLSLNGDIFALVYQENTKNKGGMFSGLFR